MVTDEPRDASQPREWVHVARSTKGKGGESIPGGGIQGQLGRNEMGSEKNDDATMSFAAQASCLLYVIGLEDGNPEKV